MSAPAATGARHGLALERLELSDPRWAAFVAGHDDATPVHDPAWAQLIADCYGFDGFALAALDARGEVAAGLPVVAVRTPLRRATWASLPFTDHCPPLLGADVAPAAMTSMLRSATADAGVASIELRCGLPEVPAAAIGYRHVLELPEQEELTIDRLRQNNVRRAIKTASRDERLEVRVADSREQVVDAFYDLHLHTRRRHGTPIQPRRFFRLLWERVLEPGRGSLLLAYVGHEPIAGAVFLHSRRMTLYKYAASDPASWARKPNHLIIWTAMRLAQERDVSRVDFGRTDLDNDGLRSFKSSWGAVEETLAYTRVSESGAAAVVRGEHALLACAIRRSPPLVCRLTGELLYRYAA